MTQDRQDRGDRLDRIEAALENIQQRLDSQVEVNAELRTSVETLKNTTDSLQNTVNSLQSTVADFRLSAEALLQVATIHQRNFEQLTNELNSDRIEWRSQIERLWQRLEQQ